MGGDQLERRCNAPLLYALTHAATEEFNALAEEFEENDSELETAAREAIAEDFEWIAKAYGVDADIEELIAPRTGRADLAPNAQRSTRALQGRRHC